MLVADLLLALDESAGVADGVEACGVGDGGLVPAVEGQHGEAMVAIAYDGGCGA